MRLGTVGGVALLVTLLGACSGDPDDQAGANDSTGSTSSSTTSTTDTTTTTIRPATTVPSPGGTGSTIAATAGAAELEAARSELLQLIASEGTRLSSAHGGTLNADGSIASQRDPGGIQRLQLDLRALVDSSGAVWFAVLGDPATVAGSSLEFEGVLGDGRSVGTETTVTGSEAGPAWVDAVPAGSALSLAGSPAPPPPDGYLLLSDLAVVDGRLVPRAEPGGAAMLSLTTWAYRSTPEGVPGGQWLYRAFRDGAESLPARSGIDAAVTAWTDAVDGASAQVGGAARLAAANDDRIVWISPVG